MWDHCNHKDPCRRKVQGSEPIVRDKITEARGVSAPSKGAALRIQATYKLTKESSGFSPGDSRWNMAYDNLILDF